MYKKHFWLLEFKGLQCRDMFLMTQAIQREQTSQTFSIKSYLMVFIFSWETKMY